MQKQGDKTKKAIPIKYIVKNTNQDKKKQIKFS